jgi:hypothetical protein
MKNVIAAIGIPLFLVIAIIKRYTKLPIFKSVDAEGFPGFAAALGLAYYCGWVTIALVVAIIFCVAYR